MTIQELLETLEEKVIKHITCNFSQYQSSDKDPNTLYYVTDRKAVFKGPIKLCDLSEIGELRSLQTSDNSSLVAAINEVNRKAMNNQGGSGVINDSTISLFAGFMTEDEMNQIVLENTDSNDGAVYCDFYGMGFYYKVGNMFHAFWNYGYEYNSGISSDGYNKAKEGKIFSYNDKHYIMYNGTLQDMSILDDTGNVNTAGIVKLSDSISGSTYDANRGVAATPKAVADLGVKARNYTNTQISNKIKIVQQLPDSPTDGILYLIPETSLSKPTEE